MSKKNVNKIKKEKISQSVADFIKHNRKLLDYANEFRRSNNSKKFVKVEKKERLYKYLSNTKVMIITANEIEKTSLFAYAYEQNKTPFVTIGMEDIVYTFFAFSAMVVAHVEINAGSYSHGGSAKVIKKVMKKAKPNIVILLGVAFGCDPGKTKLGDVLVGRQHFSYDKSSKISDENLSIKKLHIEEPDEYMLNRFKSLIVTEDKVRGFRGKKFQVVFGNMITGEFVVDSIDFREMIFKPFEAFGVIGGEMEAQGAFAEIRKYKKSHCILIKGICDWGAGKNEQIEDENPKNKLQTYAALNACKICYQLLSEKNLYSDCRMRGWRKWFYNSVIGELLKISMVRLTHYIKRDGNDLSL
ncbi:MAG: 5'-methylthioadenosine/S-adenosylhomocysteine nucleosidase [Lachnospiraceae bacterium]|nr:5'-methylthioadenosine/S-adenosylhomocysteine nucleosidase [Lachnospiraceae bacterium]